MGSIVTARKGERLFLLGNEAIVRGALEAGVAFAATYPGTPASEIGDTFSRVAAEAGLFFEYAVNEKVALEFVMGAGFAGSRAMCSMKHVGLNVAADPLVTMAYAGVIGGTVIVTCDDPSCHSSQNEQDNRYYAYLANLPLLEPSDPQEARDLSRWSFELSEKLELPVILRTTMRLSHMRGIVEVGDRTPPARPTALTIDPARFVLVPEYARPDHLRLLARMREARAVSETLPSNRVLFGPGAPLAIAAAGATVNYAADAVRALGLEGKVRLLKLTMTHPFPRDWFLARTAGVKKLLVVEELEPILEREAAAAFSSEGRRTKVLGKDTDDFPAAFELRPEQVLRAVAEVFGRRRALARLPAGPDLKALGAPEPPPRPPALCAGCPHSATYFCAKAATLERAVFETDIGCYTLGVFPPLSMAHHTIDMGSSICTAAAFSRHTSLPVFAFIGDSTFFHSGMTSLLDAVHHRHPVKVVVMDNATTAMTGHQPHPSSATALGKEGLVRVELGDVVRGLGVRHLVETDPMALRGTVLAMRGAIARRGEVSVVIARSPCPLLPAPSRPPDERRPRTYRVREELCMRCGCRGDGSRCATPLGRKGVLARALHDILVTPPAERTGERAAGKDAAAPCSMACPADVCVQGYCAQIAAGNPRGALELIREKIPFPSLCGHVCPAPCQGACIREGGLKDPVRIRALKRFASLHDDGPGAHYLAAAARRAAQEGAGKGAKVAVAGSGPAGLTAAYELLMAGCEVHVFEKEREAGGIPRRCIPDFRLPREAYAREVETIEALGVTVHRGRALGESVTWPSLREEGFRALVLATGAGGTRRLGIEGEGLPGVLDGLEVLAALKEGRRVEAGGRTAVVGGGNTAVDVARSLKRAGVAEVTLVYRRTRAEMRAFAGGIDAAAREGVRMRFLAEPARIEAGSGEGRGLRLLLRKMTLGERDAGGRRAPVPLRGGTEEAIFDTVVRATGQAAPSTLLGGAALGGRLELTADGRVKADGATGRTSVEGVFACGDAARGPSTVIDAIGDGKRAARGVLAHLAAAEGREPAAAAEAVEKVEGYRYRFDAPAMEEAARACGGEGAVGEGERGGHGGAAGRVLAEEEAVAEAMKCWGCGTCGWCRNCVDNFACPALYVNGRGRVAVDELQCNGCGVCAQLCPNGAIMPVFE